MIHYQTSLESVSRHQLEGFFVGWAHAPSAATLYKSLKQSDYTILARDDAGRVLGFISAISDGVLAAYIPLLEVLPHAQGQGIGSELVRRMLGELEHLYMVDLLCDDHLQGFYERCGLQKITGMCLRNVTGLKRL